MDAESDGAILKRIFAAEREADRIVRDAEARASAMLADARGKAEAAASALGKRLEEDRRARIGDALREAEREGERVVSEAKARSAALRERSSQRADEWAGVLLRRVLPP